MPAGSNRQKKKISPEECLTKESFHSSAVSHKHTSRHCHEDFAIPRPCLPHYDRTWRGEDPLTDEAIASNAGGSACLNPTGVSETGGVFGPGAPAQLIGPSSHKSHTVSQGPTSLNSNHRPTSFITNGRPILFIADKSKGSCILQSGSAQQRKEGKGKRLSHEDIFDGEHALDVESVLRYDGDMNNGETTRALAEGKAVADEEACSHAMVFSHEGALIRLGSFPQRNNNGRWDGTLPPAQEPKITSLQEVTSPSGSSLPSHHSDATQSRTSSSNPPSSTMQQLLPIPLAKFWAHNRSYLLVALSTIFGAVMTLFTKILASHSDGMHTIQILFVRMAITTIICSSGIHLRSPSEFPLGHRDVRHLLVLRGISGFFGIWGLWSSISESTFLVSE